MNTTDTMVYKEIDLGFFQHFYEEDKDGVPKLRMGCDRDGCERISYCSCDCNHCSFLF